MLWEHLRFSIQQNLLWHILFVKWMTGTGHTWIEGKFLECFRKGGLSGKWNLEPSSECKLRIWGVSRYLCSGQWWNPPAYREWKFRVKSLKVRHKLGGEKGSVQNLSGLWLIFELDWEAGSWPTSWCEDDGSFSQGRPRGNRCLLRPFWLFCSPCSW